MGQSRRRDANEPAIVQACRAVGADVWRLSVPGGPDLLLRYRGQVFAWEVKTATGTRTQAQRASQWPIVRSVGEALRALGVSIP